MQQLHPRAVWLFFLNALSAVLILLPILFGVSIGILSDTILEKQTGIFLTLLFKALQWIAIIVVPLVIISYIWARLSYHFYRYELKEEGFRKESGVIWKHYITVPYDRIQNVDIYRGLWDRILGLSDLRIQTAGSSGFGRYGGGAEGKLPGLAPDVAEQLRDDLIHRVRQSKNQGL